MQELAYPLPPIKILFLEHNGEQHYKATVDEHAEVKWQGLSQVLKKGRGLWALPPVKLELLRQTLEKYDFLNLDKPEPEGQHPYSYTTTDLGSYTITVIFTDGRKKTILHDLGRQDMPKKLFQLERRLKTILGIRKWAGPPMILE